MIDSISILRNPIQHYTWGSKTAIPDLLGISNPEEKPMAELWMGAHPKAPSQVWANGKWISLLDAIRSSPDAILGSRIASKFGGQLPFLFKVLAAAEPLSIQVHPDREQAREGFERENSLGIPLDSPIRNYRDDNHKPEMLCALTTFEALKGFRPVEGILALFDQVKLTELEGPIRELKMQSDGKGLKNFFSLLMRLDRERKANIISQLVGSIEKRFNERREFFWVIELGKRYPDDIGVLSPILLNLVLLRPGEAIFLPAGELHAYLQGTGLEIMANSDNVLRGGLTSKHIDVNELLKITSFQPGKPEIILPITLENGEQLYQAPAEEFFLSYVNLQGSHRSTEASGVEILLCVAGEARIVGLKGGDGALDISKGTAVIVPSCGHPYEIEGQAILWKASVP